MKWWMVLLAVVVFAPVSGQAQDDRELNVDIVIEGQVTEWPTKGEDWKYPYSSMLGIEPHENLEDVSVHIEFSTVTSKRRPLNLESFEAGRCDVVLLSDKAITPQVFPKRHGQDLDLWMPYFDKGTGVIVLIGWKDPKEKLFWSASVTIQIPEGLKSQRWEDRYLKDENNPRRLKRSDNWVGTENYPIQRVPLGSVCDQVNISTMQPRSS